MTKAIIILFMSCFCCQICWAQWVNNDLEMSIKTPMVIHSDCQNNGSVQQGAEVIVLGDYLNKGPWQVFDSATLDVSGDFKQEAQFDPGKGTVKFSGELSRISGKDIRFYNLDLTSANKVTALAPLDIHHQLQLDYAILKLMRGDLVLHNSSPEAIQASHGFVSMTDGFQLTRKAEAHQTQTFPLGFGYDLNQFKRTVSFTPEQTGYYKAGIYNDVIDTDQENVLTDYYFEIGTESTNSNKGDLTIHSKISEDGEWTSIAQLIEEEWSLLPALPITSISNEVEISTVNHTLTKNQKYTLAGKAQAPKSDVALIMPNAFTPESGDENSEFGLIDRNATDRIISFTIYNRTGKVLFDAQHTANPYWDGTCNGENQPAGAYVYVLNLLNDRGEETHYKNEFVLLR